MKRIITIVILLIIIAVGIYLFVLYQNSQEEEHGTFLVPRLEHNAFIIKEIRPESVTMNMRMLIDNPSPVGFKLDSFSYDFYIADYKASSSTYSDEIDFNKLDSSYIMLPVTLYTDSLFVVLDSLKKAGVKKTTYSVKGKFYADVPIVDQREFEYDQSFEAPLYRTPGTKIVGWEFRELEDGQAILNFTVRVINFNVFAYNFKDMEYQVTLGDQERVFEGYMPGEIDIPKKDSAELVLPVEVDLAGLGGSFIDYIFKGDDLHYDFYAKVVIAKESESIEDSPVEIYSSGDLGEIKKLAKSASKSAD